MYRMVCHHRMVAVTMGPILKLLVESLFVVIVAGKLSTTQFFMDARLIIIR